MNNIALVNNFFRKHHMYYGDINLKKATDTFLNEMSDGLNLQGSTLKMIPTYITLDNVEICNKKVLVMDAGGTNFRVALVRFDDRGNPDIVYMEKYDMPGSDGEITKDKFFDQIVEYLKPIINESDHIGFCFSYPTEILPSKDGKLICFNKEVKITGMVGEKIGENLLDKLKQKGYNASKSFVLINDTVATLLGGKAQSNERIYGSYIGFILGTGINSCYIEENANIKKNKNISSLPGTQIVNIESGGYGKAPQSDIDRIYVASTESPNTQIFEKMVSGAYQGGLLLTILKQAACENMFSDEAKLRIKSIYNLTSRQIDEFIKNPSGDNIIATSFLDENDRMIVTNIINTFYERVASLISINLAAVIMKTSKGKNPVNPVCISAEGTTFYKSLLIKPKLDRYIKNYFNEQLGVYCKFVKAENATIIGTAVAGAIG